MATQGRCFVDTLPTEILAHIFDYAAPREEFEAFSFEQYKQAGQSVEDYLSGRRTLAALGRVSTRFQALAKPRLYSRVRLFRGEIRPFARTIVGDLETRQMVERISFEWELPWTWDAVGGAVQVPPMDRETWDYSYCLGECLSLLAMAVRGDDDEASVEPEGLGGSEIVVAGNINFDDTPKESLAAVMMFVLPKLRYLRVQFEKLALLDDWQGIPGWESCELFMHSLRLACLTRGEEPDQTLDQMRHQIPAALFNLDELVLSNPFAQAGSIKGGYPTNEWCRIENMRPFWSLPNLKSLRLERTSINEDDVWQEPGILTSSVENLDLAGTSIPPASLPKILQHFPALHSFTYEAGDMEDLTADYWPTGDMLFVEDMRYPERIERIIRSCLPGLEKINIVPAIPDEERHAWLYEPGGPFNLDEEDEFDEIDDEAEG